MKVKDFVEVFDAYCPIELAMPGDAVGLQFGNMDNDIHNMMVTLDVRPDVVREAISKNVDFILAKHAPIFRPVKTLVENNAQQKMYADLIRHNISVFVAHTNIDIIENGLNDWFCEALGVTDTEFLTYTKTYQGKDFGIGRVGNLASETTLDEFILQVKQAFNLDFVRVISKNPDKKIRRVAICGGSGTDFYVDALAKDADVYITGDVTYHYAHDMYETELAVIDAGHHIEVFFTSKLANMFNKWKETYGWNIEIIESTTNTNPFIYK
jgi:dinuclear metal center YbgI/SA1388 family protein